jgi:hypothetical protein
MKVGFTGTRKGMTKKQRLSLQSTLEAFIKLDGATIEEFHHGDCIGADAEADAIAYEYANNMIIHPPIDSKHRAFCNSNDTSGIYTILEPKDYLDRNKDIIDAVDVLIFAPETKEEQLRSGTWYTVRYAKKKGKQIIGLEP